MRNASIIASLLLAASLLSVGEALAGGFQAAPGVACDFMAADGLRTRGGYRSHGGMHQCSSQRVNIISGGPVNNSIRFVAEGDAQTVTQLRLELQVNSLTGVQRTHRRMADYSRALIKNALGAELPEETEAAILAATPGNWVVDGNHISLERIVLGAPGYELHLRIR